MTALHRLDALPAPAAPPALGRKALALLASWMRRSTQRRRMADLDRRLLADIGVMPLDAWVETRKPFWKP